MPPAPAPTGMAWVMARVAGLMRYTVWPSALVAHTDPLPTARLAGADGMASPAVTEVPEGDRTPIPFAGGLAAATEVRSASGTATAAATPNASPTAISARPRCRPRPDAGVGPGGPPGRTGSAKLWRGGWA